MISSQNTPVSDKDGGMGMGVSSIGPSVELPSESTWELPSMLSASISASISDVCNYPPVTNSRHNMVVNHSSLKDSL
jgi:hypothetical protein